jgi:HEAT repeat protein
MRLPSLLLLSALLWPVPQAGAQDAIRWEPDAAAAFDRAAKEGRPLFVAFNMDGEVANDEAVRLHYKDPEIVRLSQKFVCLVGSIGSHAEGEDEACPRLGSITCAQHQAVEKEIRRRFIEGDIVRAPQHVFCAPTGEELFRKVFQISVDTMKGAMAEAIGRVREDPESKGILEAQRRRVDELLAQIESGSADQRNAAFKSLATSEDPRALPAILEKAKPGNDDMVRYTAIYSLGDKGNHAAVEPLLSYVRDKNTKIAVYALAALEKIELPQVMDPLLATLKRERDSRVKAYAIRALAKSVPESEAVRKACLQTLRDRSDTVQSCGLIAAYSLKPHPDVAKAVRALTKGGSSNLRALAIWVLGRQRDPANQAVLEQIAKDERVVEVREVVEKAVQYNGGEDVAGYDSLYGKFFWDDNWEVLTPVIPF